MIKYIAETYTGTKIGRYMEWVGVQITATDAETGKRKAVFTTNRGKSPCKKIFEAASHYKSGLNKIDAANFQKALDKAKAEAKQLNDNQ